MAESLASQPRDNFASETKPGSPSQPAVPQVHTSTRTLVTGNGVGTVVHEKQPIDTENSQQPLVSAGEQPPPYNYTLIPAARGEPITLQPSTPYRYGVFVPYVAEEETLKSERVTKIILLSCLVTFFCCCPFGFIAWIFAMNALQQPTLREAEQRLRIARVFCLCGILFGLTMLATEIVSEIIRRQNEANTSLAPSSTSASPHTRPFIDGII